MKTVKKDKVIKRVKDEEASKLVSVGWKYCSKQEWKEKVRDAEKGVE